MPAARAKRGAKAAVAPPIAQPVISKADAKKEKAKNRKKQAKAYKRELRYVPGPYMMYEAFIRLTSTYLSYFIHTLNLNTLFEC